MAPIIQAFEVTMAHTCTACGAALPRGIVAFFVEESRIYGPCCAHTKLTRSHVDAALMAFWKSIEGRHHAP